MASVKELQGKNVHVGKEQEGREVLRGEWFRAFRDRELRFIVQGHRWSGGRTSTSWRLENPNREDG